MKTRIVVFDFDNTLFNTINPLRGRVIYRKKTGKEWEHHGWYNREESLDTSIFSIYLNSKVKLEYEKHKNIPTDIVCMISERPIKMKNKIEELFEKNGLKFDYCFYRDGEDDYFKIKCDQIKKIMTTDGGINSIVIFDDKEYDTGRFNAWAKKFFQNVETNHIQYKEQI